MKTRSGRFQSLGLAAVLALGAGLAWFFLGMIVLAAMDTLFAPAGSDWETENLVVLRDGTAIIQSNKYADGVNNITLRTLDDKPYDTPSRQVESKTILSGPYSSRERLGKMAWHQRIVPVGRTSNGVIWYFVHDGLLHGHGYFVGYDHETRIRIGYIGCNGFCSDEPPFDEQFPVDGRRASGGVPIFSLSVRPQSEQEGFLLTGGKYADRFYLAVDDGLTLIDLNNRTAKVVLKDANFISASNLNGLIAVRTPDGIRILEPDGKEIRSYSFPSQLNRDGPIELWELPENEIVLRSYSSNDTLFWFDATGKVARQEHVDLCIWRSRPKWISPTTENFVGSVVAFPSPGAILAGLGYDDWKRAELQRLPRIHWSEWWPGIIGTAVISTVLAVFCYRRQRKYGLPWTWVWTGFVLLFGVPAYLGYLAHRAWPTRLPCPNCGKLAPRDRPACFACGKDFPAPALKGIEVFG